MRDRQIDKQPGREARMDTKKVAGLFKTQSGWSAATLECLSHAKGAIHRPGVIEASEGDVRKEDKVSE